MLQSTKRNGIARRASNMGAKEPNWRMPAFSNMVRLDFGAYVRDAKGKGRA